MTRRELLDPLANALGAAFLFCGVAGLVAGLHYTPDRADQERAADIQRWLDEGCTTDSDCEAMERTVGLTLTHN